MDINRRYQYQHTADMLCQLADVVELCKLNAADIGHLVEQRGSGHLSPIARSELGELTSSATTSEQFAAGLRRQAQRLRSRAAAEVSVG